MNERIKEITGQVLDELVPETWVALGYDKIKEIQYRTAELIVGECIEIVEPCKCGCCDVDEFLITRSIISQIKEHFGVQE